MTDKCDHLKKVCTQILKKQEGRARLIKKVYDGLTASIGEPQWRIDTQLFFFASYTTANEKVSIARLYRSGFSYYMHTNMATRIRRLMRYNQYNDLVSNNKARATKMPYTRSKNLELEDYYDFTYFLFRDVENLSFEDYTSTILPPILDAYEAMDIIELFHRDFVVEDNTKNRLPQIRWIRGKEAVEVTAIKKGLEIDISANKKGLWIPVNSRKTNMMH